MARTDEIPIDEDVPVRPVYSGSVEWMALFDRMKEGDSVVLSKREAENFRNYIGYAQPSWKITTRSEGTGKGKRCWKFRSGDGGE